MNIKFPRTRAFTLIELLIVITIIGILAAALLPRITSGPAKARDAQRKADLQQIATGLEFFADDNAGAYPAETTNCVSDVATSLADYLTVVPNDPQEKADGLAVGCADGYGYQLVKNGFMLFAGLESATATGEGHYMTTFTLTTGNTASTNLSDNVGKLCGTAVTGDCKTAGAATYILGR